LKNFMNTTFAILSLVLGFFPSGQPNISPQQLTIKSFAVASPRVVLCPESMMPGGASGCSSIEELRLELRVEVAGGDEGNLEYRYSVTAGRIFGKGPNVVWDFHDARPGEYVAAVRVKDRHGASASSSARVNFQWCGTCEWCGNCDPEFGPFLQIQPSCPATVIEGKPALISIRLTAGPHQRFGKLKYNWSLTAGRIINGDGTRTIEVDTQGLGGRKISATVAVDGLDPLANRQGSCTTLVVTK
jgi:hypothetical protein